MNAAKKILDNCPADAVLLSSDDPSFFYATQLEGVFEGCFSVLKNDKARIIVSRLEKETAEKQKKENKIKADILVYSDKKEAEKHLQEALRVRVLGANFERLTIKTLEKIKKMTNAKLVDVSSDINSARAVKEKEEIDKIKKAAEIAQKALERTMPYIVSGVTESELAARLEYEIKRQGASASFATICAFGENASQPHYATGLRKLKKGNFVLMDFGARWKNYCSDITRTFVLGKMNGKQREMIETAKQAQDIGINNLIEGEKASRPHIEAQKLIEKKFKGKFIHALGHSLGIEVHDGQSLSPQANFALEKNMVFTIEPGVYIEKFGGVRIEDDFVIDGKRPRQLTKPQKEIEI